MDEGKLGGCVTFLDFLKDMVVGNGRGDFLGDLNGNISFGGSKTVLPNIVGGGGFTLLSGLGGVLGKRDGHAAGHGKGGSCVVGRWLFSEKKLPVPTDLAPEGIDDACHVVNDKDKISGFRAMKLGGFG